MDGIVYGIKDLKSDTIIYIGSTINLTKRKAVHISYCFKRQRDLLVYRYIRERTDLDHFAESFAFEVLFSGEFETRQELRMKEEEFLKEAKPRCNQNKAFRTEEELKDYKREYEKTEKRREYNREYNREYEKTEKRREYRREYHKAEKWRNYQKNEKWREYHREYNREYRRKKKLAQESQN